MSRLLAHLFPTLLPGRFPSGETTKEREKQGDSLIHSRPIKENKRGAHFFFFQKRKEKKKNHYDIALTGAVTPVQQQQQLFFFFFRSFFFFYLFLHLVFSLFFSVYTNIFFFFWPCVSDVRTLCAFLWRLVFIFFLFLLYMWPYRRADNTMSLFLKKDSQIYILSSRTKLRTANNILLHNRAAAQHTHKKRERRQKKNTIFFFCFLRSELPIGSQDFFFFWAITFFVCVLLSVPFRFFFVF